MTSSSISPPLFPFAITLNDEGTIMADLCVVAKTTADVTNGNCVVSATPDGLYDVLESAMAHSVSGSLPEMNERWSGRIACHNDYYSAPSGT